MVAFHGANLRKLVPPGSARAYAFALFCVVVAALVRWAVGQWFEGVIPFVTFFPAVLLAALVGGIGPGILAALLGGLIGWWAFFNPPVAFFPLNPGQVISLIASVIICLILVLEADHYPGLA